MNLNRCSPEGRERPPGSPPGRLAALAAVVDDLAAQDLAGLPDGVRAERVLGRRRLLDRLEGQWLGELAGVDGCGAAGAEQGIQAASTAGWLRGRLRMGAGAASSLVRTIRALFTHPTDDNRPWSEPAGAASCRCPLRTPTHRARWAPGARTTPTQVPGEKMGPKDPDPPHPARQSA